MLSGPPVRLCCSQRHAGVQCPDGLVMCAICFGRFTLGELNITRDGDWEDVCRACAEHERRMMTIMRAILRGSMMARGGCSHPPGRAIAWNGEWWVMVPYNESFPLGPYCKTCISGKLDELNRPILENLKRKRNELHTEA